MVWNLQIAQTDLYHVVQWFLIYSILGWCVESIYMSFCEKKLVNRGFIFGPICPIYGFGAVGAFFLLQSFQNNYVALYIFGSIIATLFEFFVAKMMLFIFGEVWWDYKEKPFNYQGIICLESTLAWGMYTVCLFGFLHKIVMRMADMYSVRIGLFLSIAIFVYYMIDFIIHIQKAKAFKLPEPVYVLSDKVRDIGTVIRRIYR